MYLSLSLYIYVYLYIYIYMYIMRFGKYKTNHTGDILMAYVHLLGGFKYLQFQPMMRMEETTNQTRFV